VGNAIGERLDRTITNRATPGAQIRKRGFASALGLGMPDQLVIRPSPKGSAAIGHYLAQTIKAN